MSRSSTSAIAEEVRRSRSILREGDFVRLWVGTTALATWALPFVLGLGVLARELRAVGLGVVLAARTVGFLVAVPVAGVLADRHSRRAVVLGSALAAAVAAPVLASGLGRSVPVMAVAAMVMGAGQGACRPAFQALVADVVAADRRQAANAAITLAMRTTTLLSPGVTALLASAVDTRGLLWGIGIVWLGAALIPSRGRRSARTTTASTARVPLLREFAEGVREARRHPWFLADVGALSATVVALPLISRDRYDAEAVLAAALTAYTAGGVVRALVVTRWRPRAQGWVALAAPVLLRVRAAGVAVAGALDGGRGHLPRRGAGDRTAGGGSDAQPGRPEPRSHRAPHRTAERGAGPPLRRRT